VGAVTVYVAERKQRRTWKFHFYAPFFANCLYVLGTLLVGAIKAPDKCRNREFKFRFRLVNGPKPLRPRQDIAFRGFGRPEKASRATIFLVQTNISESQSILAIRHGSGS